MRKKVAVIDIGSDDITLNIAEKHGSNMKNIDTLIRHLSLGQDTFLSGKISNDGAEKTAAVLQGFDRIINEYGISDTIAIATTAMREAENMPYIIEQLRTKTGLDIDVIDSRREKIQISKLVYASLSDKIDDSATLLVHLGGGTIGLTLIENGEITDTMTLFTSALRLSKQFESRDRIDHLFYSDVINEYLEGYLAEINRILDKSAKNFVITGSIVDLIAQMCGKKSGELDIIEKQRFSELYKNLKKKTPRQISEDHGIGAEASDVLLTAVVILNRLLKFTTADKLYCPHITIGEAIAYQTLFPKESEAIDKLFAEFSITSARKICQKFHVNTEHADRIAETALMIFDRTRKYHRLTKNERLLLHLACLLQNCGKFVNVTHHHEHSCNIIKGLNIVGIDTAQQNILALTALYHNKSPRPDSGLSPSEYVVVSQLSAILRLANSVNKSYNKGYEKIDVSVRDSRLMITIHTYKNIELEKWSFLACAPFFREVFGMEVQLAKRSVM